MSLTDFNVHYRQIITNSDIILHQSTDLQWVKICFVIAVLLIHYSWFKNHCPNFSPTLSFISGSVLKILSPIIKVNILTIGHGADCTRKYSGPQSEFVPLHNHTIACFIILSLFLKKALKYSKSRSINLFLIQTNHQSGTNSD